MHSPIVVTASYTRCRLQLRWLCRKSMPICGRRSSSRYIRLLFWAWLFLTILRHADGEIQSCVIAIGEAGQSTRQRYGTSFRCMCCCSRLMRRTAGRAEATLCCSRCKNREDSVTATGTAVPSCSQASKISSEASTASSQARTKGDSVSL